MALYKTFYKGFLIGQNVLYVSCDFGKRNLRGKIENHNGIDIAVPQGTILLAPLSGKVVKHGVQKNGAGLYIKIRHIVTTGIYIDIILAHLSSIENYIGVGYDVFEGQQIAKTGGVPGTDNAGNSTGAHLHLEIRNFGSTPVDPKYWFLAKETLISKKTSKVLNQANPSLLNFPDTALVTQTRYKYSTNTDITVANATEYSETIVKKQSTVAKKRLAPGIWQIVKILMDSSVRDKQVCDAGIATQQGSLLNFFRKVCQEPLVEFMGDTWGNQYYWIVRRPPFDKEGIKRMMELCMLELTDDMILTTDLTWNNQGIYSWYQYLPYADLIDGATAKYLIPAVFFPEFASVWGSKPFCIESNYFNFNFSGRFNVDKEQNKQNSDRIMRNVVRDFKYLIESNAYNAFTRRGTITLIGDRRIKRGTFVLHTSGEIFHVDSVTNNYSVNSNNVSRTTILNVSRGIYPAYIEGKMIAGKEISYFNIIDFGDATDIEKVNSENFRNVISKWRVNLDSFGFFMSKQQVFREKINVQRKQNE